MHRRRGFTLVELLVVIAIIGILVALLLPAVQKARESAQLMQCKSNMRNVALAAHNHHSAKRAFPSGFEIQPKKNEAWGWSTYLLPYLEEQPLYDQLGIGEQRLADFFRANRRNPEAIAIAQTPLPIFRCATDNTPSLLPGKVKGDRHFRGNFAPSWYEPPTSNYIGLKGIFDNKCNPNNKKTCENNGIFYGGSKVRIRDIKDGTTKTFLMGERDGRCKAGTYIGARNPPGAGMFGSYMLIARVSIRFNFPLTGAHNTCTEGFSSSHDGGGNFAFADGSVHFISNDIDFNNGRGVRFPQTVGVYQRFGQRDDGLTVSLEDN